MENTRRSFSQDDAFRSKHVVDACLSNDGLWAVYVLNETIKKAGEETPFTSLWMVNVETTKRTRLSSVYAASWAPSFAVDGQSVYFLSVRDPDRPVPQIYRLNLEGGEAEPVTDVAAGVDSYLLSPDGSGVAYTTSREVSSERAVDPHIRVTRQLYRADPIPVYLDQLEQKLCVLDLKTGDTTVLHESQGLIYETAWSPDSQSLAFAIMFKPGHRFMGMADLCLVDRQGKQFRELLSECFVLSSLFWLPDNQRLGFSATSAAYYDSQPELWVMNTQRRGSLNQRSAKLDLAINGLMQVNSPSSGVQSRPKLSADGGSVYISVARGGGMGIWRIRLRGAEKATLVAAGQRICRLFDAQGSQLLMSSQTSVEASKLVVFDIDSGKERILADHNVDWSRDVRFPKVKNFMVDSGPSTKLEAWVMMPRAKKKPYRTILYIHGGPHAAIGWGYSEDILELVGAGFAVVTANPRGSTGYGQAFAQANIGNWGPTEEEDLNAVLDHLIGEGIADAKGLGLMGYSAGGHLSAWMSVNGKPGRFKAAIPEQGLYNMFGMYGVSDVGVALIEREMGGPPHQKAADYWRLSPVAHAHKCTTPTLLIQGEDDLRTPMSQAEQLYTILKHNGCEVELLRLQNCRHGDQVNAVPALRRYRMDAIKAWFERHL